MELLSADKGERLEPAPSSFSFSFSSLVLEFFSSRRHENEDEEEWEDRAPGKRLGRCVTCFIVGLIASL